MVTDNCLAYLVKLTLFPVLSVSFLIMERAKQEKG